MPPFLPRRPPPLPPPSSLLHPAAMARKAKNPARRRRTPAAPPILPSSTSPIFFWKETEVPYGVFSQWFVAAFTAPSPDDGTIMTFDTAEQ